MPKFLAALFFGSHVFTLCSFTLCSVIAVQVLSVQFYHGQVRAAEKVPLPEKKQQALNKQAAITKPNLPVKNDSTTTEVVKAPEEPNRVSLADDLSLLNKISLSEEQKTLINKGIKSIFRNNGAEGMKYADQLTDGDAKKLLQWYALRNSSIPHSYNDLNVFLKGNPGWPSRSQLLSKIEGQIYKGALTPAEVVGYYKSHKPKTLAGKVALGEALIVLDKKAEGKKLIAESWQSPWLANYLEARILGSHSLLLSEQDHINRIDNLLYQEKKSKIRDAINTSKKVGEDYQKATAFRAAVLRRQHRHAKKLLAKLSDKVKAMPGVYLSRVQLARRSKNMKQAVQLLVNAKFKDAEISDKDQWWNERVIHTRVAVNEQNYDVAYKIASNHNNPSVNKYNEAEFLSGWIALRFLNKPELAEKHFLNFKKTADGPRTRSKSGYWLGRTYQILKNKTAAEEAFKFSASLYSTYYGQLSLHELSQDKMPIVIPSPMKINPDIAKRFTERAEIKTIILAHLAEQKSIVRLFFSHLRYHLSEPGELTLLARLAADLGYNQSSVRIGKTAMSQNVPLDHYSYPVNFIPRFKPLRSIPENALIYSIARQESEFNQNIVSHAGARGLLQVMPNTLKHVARQYKIKRQVAWLTQKPAYNVRIASAYIGDRHDQFDGSYIMTFAGFNAGPGRVRQWVRQFGDPRDKKTDAIDWVERIPFQETRNYVQKVLANVQIYRARLGKNKALIKTYQDLQRGKN